MPLNAVKVDEQMTSFMRHRDLLRQVHEYAMSVVENEERINGLRWDEASREERLRNIVNELMTSALFGS